MQHEKTKKADGMIDPSRPECKVEIDGKSYSLYFDFGALALAEQCLEEAGQPTNMLAAMDLRGVNARRLPIVFFAALQRKHPDITPDQARAMVTLQNYPRIYEAVVAAYLLDAMPKKKEDAAADSDPPADHAPE